MKYMGSKNRIAKHILPIILRNQKPGQTYVESFVGGGNMIEKVSGIRIGSDLCEDVISALCLIRDNVESIPQNNKQFTEQDYQNRCENFQHLKGFASYAYSYGGKHWGGWCRDSKGVRDYVAEAYRNAIKQHPKLQGIKLINCSYDELEIPPNSIIYCDPPYARTTKYKSQFNHEQFWQWCREQHELGHEIYISEYDAPDDFLCLWEKEIVSSLTQNTGAKKGMEKLFGLS